MLTYEQAGQLLSREGMGETERQFLAALIEADVIVRGFGGGISEAILHFVEKPWQYATEFVAWDTAGRPMDDSEAGWEEFFEAVTD